MTIRIPLGGTDSFEPCPPGIHQAVCCDVVYEGWKDDPFNPGTKREEVRVVWQVDERRDDGKPYLIQRWYKASLHEKSNLRKDLEGWRGKPFSYDDLVAFAEDLEKLIGKQCQLNVVHKVSEKTGNTYAQVKSIVPIGKGMSPLTVRDYVRDHDRPKEAPPAAAQPASPRRPALVQPAIQPDVDTIPF